MQSYDEPVYMISVVAKILDIHPQTLRQYEREGLIEPDRTKGKMRLYSQNDVDRIKMILRLTRDLGLNLAGVDVVFRLKEQIDEYEEMIEDLKKEIDKFSNTATKRNLEKRRTGFDLIFVDDKKRN